MSKLDFMPECFGPDPWLDLPGSLARPRRRRPRWGVAFHKDHDHPHDHMGRPGPARYAGPIAPGLHDRRGRAGRLGQDGPGRGALPRSLARDQPRRHHERHLHPRGRRVPLAQRRAAGRAHRRRADRRLPAHGDPRRRQRQPRAPSPTSSASSPASSWSWSSPAATT